MALRRLISNSAELHNDISSVKNLRKSIFNVRDKLRDTTQFSKIFSRIIGDVNHPPRLIEANQNGSFWSEGWDASARKYEPYTTKKLEDHNIGYIEGCAIYLLIQECYPTVYDFPNNSMQAIENGVTIKLVMKDQFLGKKLIPAVTPPGIQKMSAQMRMSAAIEVSEDEVLEDEVLEDEYPEEMEDELWEMPEEGLSQRKNEKKDKNNKNKLWIGLLAAGLVLALIVVAILAMKMLGNKGQEESAQVDEEYEYQAEIYDEDDADIEEEEEEQEEVVQQQQEEQQQETQQQETQQQQTSQATTQSSGTTDLEGEIEYIREIYYSFQYNQSDFYEVKQADGTVRYEDSEGYVRKVSAPKGTYSNISTGNDYDADFYYEYVGRSYRLRFAFIWGNNEEYRIYFDQNEKCIRFINPSSIIYNNSDAVNQLDARKDLKQFCSKGKSL